MISCKSYIKSKGNPYKKDTGTPYPKKKDFLKKIDGLNLNFGNNRCQLTLEPKSHFCEVRDT